MKAEIRDYRRLERADLDLSLPLTLIGAKNENGKSSLAQALGAGFTGETVPIDDVLKSNAGLLVRSGGKGKGHVKVFTDGGSREVNWPKAKDAITDGAPPRASLYAVGRRSLMALKQKDRAPVVLDYLKAFPTLQDLEPELKDLGIESERIKKIWDTIQKLSWDNAHATAKDQGAKYKAQWAAVAQDMDWGIKQSASWVPKDWEEDLGNKDLSEHQLTEDVVAAKQIHEAAVAEKTLSEHERQELEKQVKELDEHLAVIQELQQLEKTREAEWKAEKEKLEKMPKLTAVQVTEPCPHAECKRPIVVTSNGKLELPDPKKPSKEKLKKNQEEIDAQAKIVNDKFRIYESTFGESRMTSMKIADCRRAKKKLEETSGAVSDESVIAEARNQVARAEARLQAWKRKREADQIHQNIVQNLALVELLAPTGLRQRKLAKALQEFNAKLQALSDAGNWGDIKVTHDLDVESNGWQFALCSASKQFRITTLLQLAMAQLDGSEIVIIDAAEIFDKERRTGLLSVLKASGLKCVVLYTANERAEMPDLSKKGRGLSYWIEDGVASLAHELVTA